MDLEINQFDDLKITAGYITKFSNHIIFKLFHHHIFKSIHHFLFLLYFGHVVFLQYFFRKV